MLARRCAEQQVAAGVTQARRLSKGAGLPVR